MRRNFVPTSASDDGRSYNSYFSEFDELAEERPDATPRSFPCDHSKGAEEPLRIMSSMKANERRAFSLGRKLLPAWRLEQ